MSIAPNWLTAVPPRKKVFMSVPLFIRLRHALQAGKGVCVCVYLCVYVCLFICVSVYMCLCVSVCMHLSVSLCVCVSFCVYLCVFICVCMCVGRGEGKGESEELVPLWGLTPSKTKNLGSTYFI